MIGFGNDASRRHVGDIHYCMGFLRRANRRALGFVLWQMGWFHQYKLSKRVTDVNSTAAQWREFKRILKGHFIEVGGVEGMCQCTRGVVAD